MFTCSRVSTETGAYHPPPVDVRWMPVDGPASTVLPVASTPRMGTTLLPCPRRGGGHHPPTLDPPLSGTTLLCGYHPPAYAMHLCPCMHTHAMHPTREGDHATGRSARAHHPVPGGPGRRYRYLRAGANTSIVFEIREGQNAAAPLPHASGKCESEVGVGGTGRVVHFMFEGITACGLRLDVIEDASGFGLVSELGGVSCVGCRVWLGVAGE